MNRILSALAATAAISLPLPALATEWMYCGDAEGTASIGLLLGSTDVLSVSALTLSAGDTDWVTSEAYGPGAIASVGQAFGDDEKILVDVLDGNFDKRVAALRIFVAETAAETVYGGVLTVEGKGTWAVTCEY